MLLDLLLLIFGSKLLIKIMIFLKKKIETKKNRKKEKKVIKKPEVKVKKETKKPEAKVKKEAKKPELKVKRNNVAEVIITRFEFKN